MGSPITSLSPGLIRVTRTWSSVSRGCSHIQHGLIIFMIWEWRYNFGRMVIGRVDPFLSTSHLSRHPAMLCLLVGGDRKSTRLNSSHQIISYAVFCLKKKTKTSTHETFLLSGY